MTRRFVVQTIVIAFAVGALLAPCPKPSRAQGRDDVFADVELPDVSGGPNEDGASEPEELPIGDMLPDDPTLALPDDPSVSLAPPPTAEASAIEPPRQEESIASGDPELIPGETVRERFPSGRVRVERGVTLDEQENYVNHGPWKKLDEEGNLIVEGSYKNGERHGRWVRFYAADEAELFSAPPFSMFTPPFRSEAEFTDGQLNGRWVITDKHERKISDWSFTEGRRDGLAVWWYPNAKKMRELTYEFGQPDGDLIEWNDSGDVVTRVEYQDGRRLEKTTRQYKKSGQKAVEGMVLRARLVMQKPDDWWSATLSSYTREGKDEKHGEWTAWYPNGQMKFSGEFVYGNPTGEFTWWFTNGQVSLQGAYQDGQKQGAWTWWHESGLKSIQGFYEANSPTDRWIWWHENGRVAQRVDFSNAGQPNIVSTEETARRESSRRRPADRRAAN